MSAMVLAAAAVAAAACGAGSDVRAGGPVAVPATARVTPTSSARGQGGQTVTVTVTCPGLGSVSLALPSGVADPPLPPEVILSIAYQATDTQTQNAVAGGEAAGQIACGKVPFTDLTPEEVAPAAPVTGVAPGHRLTGNWLISATVGPVPIVTVP